MRFRAATRFASRSRGAFSWGKGEGFAEYAEGDAFRGNNEAEPVDPRDLTSARAHHEQGNDRPVPAGAGPATETALGERSEPTESEAGCGTNAWIYCACMEPETEEERAAWRKAMPLKSVAATIRRPREFARALGGMVAEQVGPRGRIVLLKNTLDGHVSCTAHKSQPVYHGPVVYSEEPDKRLERASSELELMLLRIFMKHAAHRAQREYRFAVWAEET